MAKIIIKQNDTVEIVSLPVSETQAQDFLKIGQGIETSAQENLPEAGSFLLNNASVAPVFSIKFTALHDYEENLLENAVLDHEGNVWASITEPKDL